jgi:hypothetical protein
MDCKDRDCRYITQVQEVLRLAIEAITAFFANESDLLDVSINERSLTHKLAEHLEGREGMAGRRGSGSWMAA